MQCLYCGQPLAPGVTICPSCGHSTSADPDATIMSSRTAAALAQAAAPPPAVPEPAAPAPRTVTPPAARPRPAPRPAQGVRALFMDFNQSPREIVRVMDETRQNVESFRVRQRRRRRLLWLAFPLGLPFVLADVLLGFNICTFSLVALVLWLGAFAGLILSGRRATLPQLGSRFDLSRTIFDTLKDDVLPKRVMVGWLDLTGAAQESKQIRQKTSARGQPIVYYHDEWLRLKTSLYDGNVLRLVVADRVKARQGFWKRGRSGKRKYRSGSSQSECRLEMSISVDTGKYKVLPFQAASGVIPNTRLVIRQAEAGQGRVVLSAAGPAEFDAWDILTTLRFGYDRVQLQQ
jgi:hypothetical protein